MAPERPIMAEEAQFADIRFWASGSSSGQSGAESGQIVQVGVAAVAVLIVTLLRIIGEGGLAVNGAVAIAVACVLRVVGLSSLAAPSRSTS